MSADFRNTNHPKRHGVHASTMHQSEASEGTPHDHDSGTSFCFPVLIKMCGDFFFFLVGIRKVPSEKI